MFFLTFAKKAAIESTSKSPLTPTYWFSKRIECHMLYSSVTLWVCGLFSLNQAQAQLPKGGIHFAAVNSL